MEAAIAWLVQTILATLLIDKLDAWIRQVGLADDVEKLKSEVERVEMVVGDVRGRAAGSRLLARLLASLKDLLYEADDLIDELDYYRLQQQVQGGAVIVDDPQAKAVPATEQVDDTSRGNADMPLDDTSSNRGVKKRKKRSKAWENYNVTEEDEDGNPLTAACKHCLTPIKCAAKHGTSGMLNHNKVCQKKPGANDQPPNPSSAGDATETATRIVIADSSGRKRRREDQDAAHITVADTYTPWDKAELSNRIQKITSQLQNVREEVSELLKLHGSDSASSSNHHSNTASYQHLRTSSLLSRKVYGRVAEKISIKKFILEDKSDGVRVLPIVGIGGVGKTALAQFVYNDPEVESQFQHRIWVWVSRNFDEMRLTREMLDFVSSERHEGINNFAKLQEILKSHANSKRLLLIFDDVWDDMKDCQWDKLLAPFRSGQGNGIVVIVTTRNLSVAERLGTLKPIKLGALEHDDFWSLFKSRAFGDGTYEGPRNLSTIGLKIAEKLKGNPLAAVSVGALLRKHLTVDHWSKILGKEDWKSLGLSGGIMTALKLSYDQLPYHLQQCFSYCSIFPNKHKFLGKDLIYIWISQGFVNRACLTKRLEETGWKYLTDLVNLGFFQQVKQEEEFSPDSQIWYSECGLMHDFARMVSRTECATIDGLQCNKMLPSIHHLSIVTSSAYNSKDQHGNIPRDKKFEENLRNTVTSVRKLRTLVLLGNYDPFFFQLFQDIFQKAGNLRLVQMSAALTDFNSFMCLANPTHLRYLKRGPDQFDVDLSQGLIKFFHLQVLDIGSYTYASVPDGVNNLVNLRHLVAYKRVYSSIASIGKMTSLQELHDFKVQMSSSFEITQLQSMSELVQLGLSQLHSVKTGQEAYGARLREKVHLEKLHLSWEDIFSDHEYGSDASSESSEELLSMDDGGPSSEPSMDTAREVLEGLEPHMNLKHLQVSGYNGTTSPTWLASNIPVTSLQTLHLHGCGGWRILPSLESLPFLTKLKLSSMREVTEVLVPSLEEIVLIKMPKLVRCSSTSVEGLSTSLRAVQIENCHALKMFDLFEDDDDNELEIEQRSWLPRLRKLILLQCPQLQVLKFLPPSTTCSELLITGISVLPSMKGSSNEELRIGHLDDDYEEEDRGWGIDESSNELRILDNKILEFRNLRNLKSMRIVGCRNLISFSFEGFSHLVSLRSLEISLCEQLFSSDGMPDATREDVTALNCKAFPSLGRLDIESCGIQGKWLSRMLQHAPQLEELRLTKCPHITAIILTEEGENSKSNHLLAREDSSSRNAPDAPTGLARDERLHIPLQTPSSLNNITIINGLDLFDLFDLFEDDDEFEVEQRTSLPGLRKLVILSDCPRLEVLSPLPPSTTASELFVRGVSLPSMQGSFSEKLHIGHLKEYDGNFIDEYSEEYDYSIIDEYSDELRILDDKILAFRNLTNLKSMTIDGCLNLTSFSLEGFSHLVSLKNLELQMCEKLFSSDVIAEYIFEDVTAFPSLQSLSIYSCGITGEWLCLLLQHAPVLEDLHLQEILAIQEGDSLPGEQDDALTLLARDRLVQIPLNLISSLKKASIHDCPRLTFKWSEEGFSGCTSSLQELNISEWPQLLSSLVHNDGNDDPANGRLLLPASLEGLVISDAYSVETLQPCFPSDLTSLKRLVLWASPDLESLQLRSCTALEMFVIAHCESLTELEGLESLGSLRHLDVYSCPGLGPCLERLFSMQGYELCSRLETFHVEEPSVFTTSSCVGLTSLQRLKLQGLVLTEEQGRALGLLTCLQELEFYDCNNLVDLPAGLHAIPSLKRLKIESCEGILRLPETGLPLSLEELEIKYCSKVLADQCRLLATSKLNVKIVGCHY